MIPRMKNLLRRDTIKDTGEESKKENDGLILPSKIESTRTWIWMLWIFLLHLLRIILTKFSNLEKYASLKTRYVSDKA